MLTSKAELLQQLLEIDESRHREFEAVIAAEQLLDEYERIIVQGDIALHKILEEEFGITELERDYND